MSWTLLLQIMLVMLWASMLTILLKGYFIEQRRQDDIKRKEAGL